jgi:hypothetical protein
MGLSSSSLSSSMLGERGGVVALVALRSEDRVLLTSIGAEVKRGSFSPSES